MNEKFIHAFISKKQPKSVETKRTSSETHKNKKVTIGDDQVLYPDGAVTMDEDCEHG